MKLNHQPLTVKPVAAKSNSSLTSNAVPSSCSTTITPACLQDIYGIPSAPASESSSTLAVSGFIEQYANAAGMFSLSDDFVLLVTRDADLKTFLTDLRTDIDSSTTFTLVTLDGVRDNGAWCTCTTLTRR